MGLHTKRRSNAIHTAALEVLEARRMLASIEGNVWNDTDNDGLRDFFENPVPGLTIFIDPNKNNRLDAGETTTVTDARGFYRFDDLPVVPFDPATGTGGTTYNIAHVPFLDDDGTQIPISQTSPGVTGRSNVQSAFDIEIVYAGSNLSDDQKTLIESSVAVWEEVIIGDLPNVGGIDDLQITFFAEAVDGPLGILAFARPSAFRDPSVGNNLSDFQGNPVGLSSEGEITIDSADINASRAFVETVVHEIGHVVGIGSMWDNYLINRGTAGVSYIGEKGVEEYSRLFGQTFSSVPVEPQVEGHWDANALANEMMNPFSSGGFDLPPDADPLSALSRLTIGAMEDFGYKVNYGRAEPYGPFNIGPLPEDLLPELGFVPFEITSFLRTTDEVVDDANFGVRFNSKPDPFFLTAGPAIATPGQPLRLLVEFNTVENPKTTGDSDYRDSVFQFNFYRESNGLPGVQTSVDVARGTVSEPDELLAQDASATDGYELTIDTTGQPLGEQIFYARAFDEGFFVRDRLVTVDFVPLQTVPAKPESLRAIGTDGRTIQLNWIDASTNENGFVLDVSTSPNFDVPDDITRQYLPAQEGTGPYTFEFDVVQGELTTRYFRVRSFNTGGSSLFAGRVTARTLSRLEVLVDNEDESRVRNIGGWSRIIDRGNSTNLTYLSGTSGFVEYDPSLAATTDFFVFLRNPSINTPGRVLVSVIGEGGTAIHEVEINQAASAGSDVQIGRFRLGPNSFVRLTHVSGTARADTVRFLPAG